MQIQTRISRIFVGLFKLSMAAPTAIAGVDAAIRSRLAVTPRFAAVLLQGGVDVVSLDRRLLRRGDLAATCSSSPVSHGATPVAHPCVERLHWCGGFVGGGVVGGGEFFFVCESFAHLQQKAETGCGRAHRTAWYNSGGQLSIRGLPGLIPRGTLSASHIFVLFGGSVLLSLLHTWIPMRVHTYP